MKYNYLKLSVCLLGLTGCVSSKLDFENDPKLALSKGAIAGDFGSGLNESNRLKAVQVEHDTLESGITGATITWVGIDNVKGGVTPGQPYQVGTATCRTYTHALEVSGQSKVARGTACKEKNSDWVPLD